MKNAENGPMAVERLVFDFQEYRDYLKHRTEGRGQRSALAKAINSPVSHISQVLGGLSHMSLEQGEAANKYWEHSEDEGEFFLLLIQANRAGTVDLRKRFERQIKRILERRLVISHRIEVKETISPQDQAQFYSSWHYQALHILATIPNYQTKQAMAKRLNLSIQKVTQVLDFLISIGLVVKSQDRYKASVERIHLGNDSLLISKHHANWRMKALLAFEQENSQEGLHYSSVVSLSLDDVNKIKNLSIEHINQVKKIVRSSPEEELFCFAIDCFKV